MRLAGELREALEQQRVTSEVLRVISSSRGELEPVFKAILEAATRIGEAAFGNLFLCEGPIFQTVGAVHGQQGYAEYWRHEVVDVRDNPGIPLDRIAKTKQVVHIPDLGTDSSNIPRNERIVSLVKTAGARSFVAVPMLKDSEFIGAIAMYRQEVRPFTDKSDRIGQEFRRPGRHRHREHAAAQRITPAHRDLQLEQQTATSEVLRSSAVRLAI